MIVSDIFRTALLWQGNSFWEGSLRGSVDVRPCCWWDFSEVLLIASTFRRQSIDAAFSFFMLWIAFLTSQLVICKNGSSLFRATNVRSFPPPYNFVYNSWTMWSISRASVASDPSLSVIIIILFFSQLAGFRPFFPTDCNLLHYIRIFLATAFAYLLFDWLVKFSQNSAFVRKLAFRSIFFLFQAALSKNDLLGLVVTTIYAAWLIFAIIFA